MPAKWQGLDGAVPIHCAVRHGRVANRLSFHIIEMNPLRLGVVENP